MLVTVGRIGKAHGIRGAITVQVLTDDPERRFAVGTTYVTEPATARPLVVRDMRWHSGRLLLELDGVDDRNAAESLRGTLLQVDVDEHERPEDPDEYYDHQLVGLPVRLVDGQLIGHVREISHLPAQDLVVVAPEIEGNDLLFPFVHEIVVAVDIAEGLVVDPPVGLLPGTEVDADPVPGEPLP